MDSQPTLPAMEPDMETRLRQAERAVCELHRLYHDLLTRVGRTEGELALLSVSHRGHAHVSGVVQFPVRPDSTTTESGR